MPVAVAAAPACEVSAVGATLATAGSDDEVAACFGES